MPISRRHILASTPALALLAAGCSTTTSGGSTTITIDVARIVTDGTAVISALQSALAAPSMAAVLGADAPLAQAALATASSALAQIQQATGGTVSASIDTSSVQALVKTLLADAQTVLGYVLAATAKLTGPIATTVGNYAAAVSSLIPFVQLAAGLVGDAPNPKAMTEAAALKAAVAR